jgi:hypothetical protein
MIHSVVRPFSGLVGEPVLFLVPRIFGGITLRHCQDIRSGVERHYLSSFFWRFMILIMPFPN